METPDIYVWIGLPGSGRRKLIYDVTHNTRSEDSHPLFLISGDEPPSDVDFTQIPNATVLSYEWAEDQFQIENFPENTPNSIHWLLQGNENPIDQLEALKNWLQERRWPLTRIVTIVSARLLEEHPKLKAYYEAAIHFTDMVLINQRDGLPSDWSQKFTHKYEKERYPCLFESVKNNRVKNPSLVLDPMPRRLSQFFDSLEELQEEEAVVDYEWEEDDGFDEEEEDPIPEDPFLARNLGGDRKFRIPDLKTIFP